MGIRFVICGLSITSSWGNGHATTYRALIRELTRRGHEVLFLEADRPWYARNRDLPHPPYCRTELYQDFEDLTTRFETVIRKADVAIVGSFVPDGARVCEWVTQVARGIKIFYDIDTPVTLARLAEGIEDYVSVRVIPRFDLYLSFTGGPTLRTIETRLGARKALPLYCSVDTDLYYPDACELRWDLGYLGTYSWDRQPTLERLLVSSARSSPNAAFVVAGAQYPLDYVWPANVAYFEHLPPSEHRGFYNAQRFTLNVTRKNMIDAGYSPSVRLFEAAACGTPILSDAWPGLGEILEIGREILVVRDGDEVTEILTSLPEAERLAIGRRARQRVLRHHSAARRAEELESYVLNLRPEVSGDPRRIVAAADPKARAVVP